MRLAEGHEILDTAIVARPAATQKARRRWHTGRNEPPACARERISSDGEWIVELGVDIADLREAQTR